MENWQHFKESEFHHFQEMESKQKHAVAGYFIIFLRNAPPIRISCTGTWRGIRDPDIKIPGSRIPAKIIGFFTRSFRVHARIRLIRRME